MSSGMNIDQLTFDTANPDDNQNVGAYIRAGSDGDQIASQVNNSEDWLNVAAILSDPADGSALSVTSGVLDVNTTIAAPDTGTANGTTSVDTTVGGVPIPASALADRQYIFVQNLSTNEDVFLGFGTVSSANGIVMGKKSSFGPIDLGPSLILKGIVASGTADVRSLEVS